jgi:putative DNA primase/helicase
VNIYEELFQGFVITKNKKSIEKIKGRNDFKTFDQVKDEPEFAGVLNENIALIDIDNTEMSDLLFKIVQDKKINCVVIKTGRGKHFLFKNNGITSNKTKCKLAISLEADIKLGIKTSYEVLKADGNLREVLLNPDEIDEIPKWLTPISANIEFINMEAGDGRNQSLFNYILTLQSADFTVEEARETIRLINKYVLKEPLKDSELETILRDDAFLKESFFRGSKFLHDKFANYIKNNNHIIKIDGKLHIYQEGTYNYALDKIEREMLKHIPSLTDAKRKEVLKYLNIVCDEKAQSDANLIAFRNGIYNLIDDSFIDYTPEVIITNKINWNYNPAAYSEIADTTLNKIACHDKEIRMLLEEVIGYCFYRRNELGKAFILTGDGSNGKSTFIAVLNKILGNENISSLDLNELGERFSTVTLYNKLANLGDDIGGNFIPDPSLFKKIVTGDRIMAEEKGQPKFGFNPYCKLIFSANSVPRMNDKSKAVIRRLVIIPFNAKFSDDNADYDPDIKYKLQSQESIEYFIYLGIQGLKRVLKNKKFSISDKVKKELEEYEIENNPVLGFLRECEDEDIEIENEPTNEVYERYCGYCRNNGFQEVSKTTFSKQLNQLAGYKTEVTRIKGKGKLTRIYVKN